MSFLSDFTPIKWAKDSWREAGEQQINEKKKKLGVKYISFENTGSISFEEKECFYEIIDLALEENKKFIITFEKEKPDKDSDLWKRLSNCKNWNEIKKQFEEISEGKENNLSKIIHPSFSAAIAESVIVVIALLLAACIIYAIYKNYKIRLKINPNTGEVELEMETA